MLRFAAPRGPADREGDAEVEHLGGTIVGHLDVGRMVLEYVPGRSLGQRIAAEGALPVEETIRLCRQIAGAVEAAHARGGACPRPDRGLGAGVNVAVAWGSAVFVDPWLAYPAPIRSLPGPPAHSSPAWSPPAPGTFPR